MPWTRASDGRSCVLSLLPGGAGKCWDAVNPLLISGLVPRVSLLFASGLYGSLGYFPCCIVLEHPGIFATGREMPFLYSNMVQGADMGTTCMFYKATIFC